MADMDLSPDKLASIMQAIEKRKADAKTAKKGKGVGGLIRQLSGRSSSSRSQEVQEIVPVAAGSKTPRFPPPTVPAPEHAPTEHVSAISRTRILESVAPGRSIIEGSHHLHNIVSAEVMLRETATDEDGKCHAALDTAASASFISKYLVTSLGHQIKRVESILKFGGHGSSRSYASEYVIVDLFFPVRHDGKSKLAKMAAVLFIAEKLPAGVDMLLGMDFLAPQQVSIILPYRKVVFGACGNAEASITVQQEEIDIFERPARPVITAIQKEQQDGSEKVANWRTKVQNGSPPPATPPSSRFDFPADDGSHTSSELSPRNTTTKRDLYVLMHAHVPSEKGNEQEVEQGKSLIAESADREPRTMGGLKYWTEFNTQPLQIRPGSASSNISAPLTRPESPLIEEKNAFRHPREAPERPIRRFFVQNGKVIGRTMSRLFVSASWSSSSSDESSSDSTPPNNTSPLKKKQSEVSIAPGVSPEDPAVATEIERDETFPRKF